MRHTHPQDSAIKVTGIGKMLENKFIRSQAIYRNYPDGKQTVIYDGGEFPKTDFEKMYPINLRPVERHGKNVDTTKEWMYA